MECDVLIMGILRSKTYVADLSFNGVLLGEPTLVTSDGVTAGPGSILDDLWFAWADPRIPNGIVNADTGQVEVTDSEVAP